MNVSKIEHIGIAVESLENAIPYYETLLGSKCYAIEEVTDQKVKTAFFKVGETKIELTVREYRLLEYLLRNTGRICGRMSIIEKVWDYDFDPGTNLVDVYVRRLREKIDDGFEPKLLHTVRGIGYVLKGAA